MTDVFVWVVAIEMDYDRSSIEGVFSSQKAAEEFEAEWQEKHWNPTAYGPVVYKFRLDDTSGEVKDSGG